MNNEVKILVTGAHFTPAVAVCEELKKEKGIKIVYVGRNSTMEGQSVQSFESGVFPALTIKFVPLIAGKLQRYISLYSIVSLFKIPVGFIQAFFILLQERPEVILSFGGYVGLPIVVCGWLLSIPIIIHEQGLQMGLANKISAYFADRVAISFKETKTLPDRITVLTGNPLRKEIINPGKINGDYSRFFLNAKKDQAPVIFITGGIQGSHIINQCVENSLATLVKKFYIIHQTGESTFGDFARLSKLQNKRYLVKNWIGKEIGNVMKFSDVIVCRAGINTLSEVTFLKKSALVIPIPYQKEQLKNAKFFEQLGTILLIPQTKLSPKIFSDSLEKILKEKNIFKKNKKRAKEILIKDASKRLALETWLLSKTFTGKN